MSQRAAILVALGLLGAAQPAFAVTVPLAGRYAIVSRTVMPHLDEMRRITAHEQHCLDTPAPDALFPVLRQPALTGCTLAPDPAGGDYSYRLRCLSDRVATGRARIELDARGGADGDLVVKMGGKNMTFSQFVRLEREGACSGP